MNSTAFHNADILIPNNSVDMSKWAVIACDQYTSEPEYWDEVTKKVGDSPSTLSLILPELFLEESNVTERIGNIHTAMDKYISDGIFNEYKNAMVYVERIQSNGIVRKGIVGAIDLEKYDFSKGSTSEVRATEATVIERIPPRIKVRNGASLELPHIMILIDDEKKDIIESLRNEVSESDVVYDFDMMMNGGHIKGYKLSDESSDKVLEKLERLADKSYFEKKYDVKDKGVLLWVSMEYHKAS